MLPLVEKNRHPALDAVLEKPFTYIRDYSQCPNFVRSIPVAAPSGTPPQKIVIRELGKEPREQILPTHYPEYPELFIHEFSDIFLCNGLPFDNNGNLIFDAIRKCNKDGNISGLLNLRTRRALQLNGRYHIFPKLKYNIPVINDGEFIFSETLDGYGNRILETLPNMWPFDMLPNSRILLVPQCTIPKYLIEYARGLNIEKECFFVPQYACIIKKLYIPTPSCMYSRYITKTATNIFQKISDYYSQDKEKYPQRIYISRSKVTNRKCLNEVECENIFTKYGFTVIYPEILSIYEQINLFSHATHVAGTIGSAMHSIVFSTKENNVKTLFLSPRNFLHIFAYSIIENTYKRACNIVYGEFSPVPSGQFLDRERSSWSIKIDNLEEAIDQWLN